MFVSSFRKVRKNALTQKIPLLFSLQKINFLFISMKQYIVTIIKSFKKKKNLIMTTDSNLKKKKIINVVKSITQTSITLNVFSPSPFQWNIWSINLYVCAYMYIHVPIKTGELTNSIKENPILTSCHVY